MATAAHEIRNQDEEPEFGRYHTFVEFPAMLEWDETRGDSLDTVLEKLRDNAERALEAT